MNSFESFIKYLKKPIFKQLFVFILLIAVIYLLRGIATLLLLTFVFIYIFNSLQNLTYRLLTKLFPVKKLIITLILYILFLSLFAFIVRIYLPVLILQVRDVVTKLTYYLLNLNKSGTSGDVYSKALIYISTNVDLSKYISSGGQTLINLLKNIGTLGLYILLSLLLSLFYMIGKKDISIFLYKFKSSKLNWLYGDIKYLFVRFSHSFGKIIQNQVLISFINAIISVIILIILRFPSVLGLGAMIFVLGMVPVAGVFISLIPLSIIAYSTGGLTEVIYILILIAALHILESYVLNPKLMSRTSKMPVFFTLFVLLISENLFGIWGLIVGIPLAMFILNLIDVLPDI